MKIQGEFNYGKSRARALPMLLIVAAIVLAAVYLNNKSLLDPTTSQSNSQNSNDSSTNKSPFGAMNKAKDCVNLSNQIATARSRGQDTSELKKRYTEVCG